MGLMGLRGVHGVRSFADLLKKQERELKKLTDYDGIPREARPNHQPKWAYVNWGRWVIDCDCGAGNAVDVTTRMAACLSCGLVHHAVRLPREHEAIEHALSRRTYAWNQNWNRDETLEQLEAENIEHGLA